MRDISKTEKADNDRLRFIIYVLQHGASCETSGKSRTHDVFDSIRHFV